MSIFGWLTGPLGNPFRLHATPRTGKALRQGVRDGYHLTWEKKELPDAGAQQFAWETYGLPPYAVYGFGNINVQQPLRETFPASYVFQSVGVVGNPPKSIVQGQFITQPLLDPNAASMMGIVTPGAIAPAPNAISNSAPILGS